MKRKHAVSVLLKYFGVMVFMCFALCNLAFTELCVKISLYSACVAFIDDRCGCTVRDKISPLTDNEKSSFKGPGLVKCDFGY